jgi:hypothetical protein
MDKKHFNRLLESMKQMDEIIRTERQNSADKLSQTAAVCWSQGKTVGNTAPLSEKVYRSFTEPYGHDVELPCDLVNAGKFRHGAARWWCRTHQTYWGKLADHARYKTSGIMQCELHAEKMHYVAAPLTINPDDYKELRISCHLPAALSTEALSIESMGNAEPQLYVYACNHADEMVIDGVFPAVAIYYSESIDLFGNGITMPVTITPPSALAFAHASALDSALELSCVNCCKCGYPHLDLGSFAVTPHKRHYCGNCGCDSTHSKGKIISTPLKPLYDRFSVNAGHDIASNMLNLDEHSDCTFSVRAAMPAIIWKASRPQQLGISVQVYRNRKSIIDGIFGGVIYQGKVLYRTKLLASMRNRHC